MTIKRPGEDMARQGRVLDQEWRNARRSIRLPSCSAECSTFNLVFLQHESLPNAWSFVHHGWLFDRLCCVRRDAYATDTRWTATGASRTSSKGPRHDKKEHPLRHFSESKVISILSIPHTMIVQSNSEGGIEVSYSSRYHGGFCYLIN